MKIPVSDDAPEAPDGFMFYRIKSGDTLVGLAVRFGVSENKIRRYNNSVCFGHRLTHITGKLLLIPVGTGTSLTSEIREQISQAYAEDETQRSQKDDSTEEQKYEEPDENGKYQLKKALMFHANGVDEHRAAYYLGEANWNVRKALNLWREDDKWEKLHTVMTTCQLPAEEAKALLERHHYDVASAIRFWKAEQKKMKKLTKKLKKAKQKAVGTEGGEEGVSNKTTEMYSMKGMRRKINPEKTERLLDGGTKQ
eukprot:CAMPEP_0202687974 /NCGR_PEP_ID=MMETSP1385-20130828/3522_1 /ASSEMBLY_ACC=CAM_ASM_000861 /TAXON_ID=933848 /ORGANISM="Elphidium margaritaceum" /LENGTH=252 /DNA_ID=CAMNT_0049342843 /DNA_START=116 /DNA_END=874 /DNA_ORIENTATION=+